MTDSSKMYLRTRFRCLSPTPETDTKDKPRHEPTLSKDDSLENGLGSVGSPIANAMAQIRDFRKRSNQAFGMIRRSTDRSIRTILNRLSHRPHLASDDRCKPCMSICTRRHPCQASHRCHEAEDLSARLRLPGARRDSGQSHQEICNHACLPEQFANTDHSLKNKPIEKQSLNFLVQFYANPKPLEPSAILQLAPI